VTAPGRFADFLFAPKHEKADVLLTTNMGPVRCADQHQLVVGGCFACCEQVQGIYANAFSVHTSLLFD